MDKIISLTNLQNYNAQDLKNIKSPTLVAANNDIVTVIVPYKYYKELTDKLLLTCKLCDELLCNIEKNY